ncbi:MAG: hypothetical protein KIB04_16135 [Pantoea sp.]|nr:hypothetical protein [Pantoea sp.]
MMRHEMADINDTLVKASVKIDDGRDRTNQLIWQMNQKRYMRNGHCPARPPAPQVAPVRIELKKKVRKRAFRVVEQAIGAV